MLLSVLAQDPAKHDLKNSNFKQLFLVSYFFGFTDTVKSIIVFYIRAPWCKLAPINVFMSTFKLYEIFIKSSLTQAVKYFARQDIRQNYEQTLPL